MARRGLCTLGLATALLHFSADAFARGRASCVTEKGGSTLGRRGRRGSHAQERESITPPWGRRCRVRGGHGQDLRQESLGTETSTSSGAQAPPSFGKTSVDEEHTLSQERPRVDPAESSEIFSPPSPAPPAPAAVNAGGSRAERASFSLFRCDAYHCERELVEDGKITFSSPATTQVMMRWNERPRRALVLLKPDEDLLPLCAQTVDFMQRDMGLVVMVEAAAMEDVGRALQELVGSKGVASELEVFHPPPVTDFGLGAGIGGVGDGEDECGVDFVVTLGGDGLLMYSNSLFRRSVPPHLCFNLGSMGFLTPFEYETMKNEVKRIMRGGVKVSLRMRLSARISRAGQTSRAFHALNEIVVDRGSSPYLTNLECYCDEQHLTTVQADGLIIATPTGSTAYSMSAGGSMVHPSVPAILFTPICPHSLSFRPIVFPDSVLLKLEMPEDSRAEARASFDGKLSQPLRRGDTLVIKTSNFPVPTICKDDSTADWFSSLDQALGFNTRIRQKAFQPPSMENIRRTRNDDRLGD